MTQTIKSTNSDSVHSNVRFLLPSNVQANKAEAEFEKGVLTIKIPTSEEVKPKSILIKAK